MILDVTDATFETDVLERSMTNPVVVDLWAPWCGPCKTLGPILEKVIGETGGRVVLAKVNVDENPATSQAFQVQSIPAVYALSGGQVVDGFMGAQPEAQIREFVNRLIGDEVAGEVAALIARGDEASLRRARELDPTGLEAAAALGGFLLQNDRAVEALEVLESVEADDRLAPLIEMARGAALPADQQSEITARLEQLLPTVKGDDEARGEFVELIDQLSVGDPQAAAQWRRKLSTALF